MDPASEVMVETDHDLLNDYRQIRAMTDRIANPLSPEDCMVQSMPDASPTRWHLAHTSWFFEQFVLLPRDNYKPFNEQFNFLFNSYYNAVGKQFPRFQRGVISRPGLDEVFQYRTHVDQQIQRMLESERMDEETQTVIQIGLNHEQQHQELMLTDIKHALSCNPLNPIYEPGEAMAGPPAVDNAWVQFDPGVYEFGFDGAGFSYDNESPRHKVYLDGFDIKSQPVTCGQFVEFIQDGGYTRPEYWLSDGWTTVNENRWNCPLYWQLERDRWKMFTLAGSKEINLNQPLCHVSYFEADAFARWAGYRLPTEFEWELAARAQTIDGNFADRLIARGSPIHPSSVSIEGADQKFFGDVWEWTASQYVGYPGYVVPPGAIGEYNGKFMCNQFVLRGGSCASSAGHLRATYRNFFPPDARWQFSGFRICR